MRTCQPSKTLAALCLTAGLATAWADIVEIPQDPIGLNLDPDHTLYNAAFLYMGFSSGHLTYSVHQLPAELAAGHHYFDFSLPRPDAEGTYYYGVVANYAFDFGFPALTFPSGSSLELPTLYSVTLGLKDASLAGAPFPFNDENSFGSALEVPDFAAIANAIENNENQDGLSQFASSTFRPDEVGFGTDGTLSGVLVDFPNSFSQSLSASLTPPLDARNFATFSIGPDTQAVPETSTYAAIIGLAGIVGGTWWRRRAAK